MKEFLKERLAMTVFAAAILGGCFYAGFYFGAQNQNPENKILTLVNKDALSTTTKVDFAPFWNVWNDLDEKFVPASTTMSATDQEKVYGAISGLVSSLKDPYTIFFPPKQAKDFASQISGSFEGVGMEVGLKDNVITVVAPLKGTPAEKAGILPGDKILKIGDRLTNGMQVDDAITLIKGPRGTQVRLTVQRSDAKNGKPIEITITRDIINVPTIDTEVKPANGKSASTAAEAGGTGLMANGVFVIHLYSFSATSPNAFREALRKFVESGSNKLILDLRGNPGGYLEAAVDMASWFLPAGKVIVTEDSRGRGESRVYRSFGYNIFSDNLKFVILINEGSASASEILAGALQEYGKAKLVGTKSFGKGSVQELIPITSDTSLKITVARWLTPKGRSISFEGLAPDYAVSISADDLAKKKDAQMEKAIEILSK